MPIRVLLDGTCFNHLNPYPMPVILSRACNNGFDGKDHCVKCDWKFNIKKSISCSSEVIYCQRGRYIVKHVVVNMSRLRAILWVIKWYKSMNQVRYDRRTMRTQHQLSNSSAFCAIYQTDDPKPITFDGKKIVTNIIKIFCCEYLQKRFTRKQTSSYYMLKNVY